VEILFKYYFLMIKGRDNIRAKRTWRAEEAAMMISTPKPVGSWRLWVLAVVFLLILGGSVYLLFFSDYFKVKYVTVDGAKENMEDRIKEMVSWESDYMILLREDILAQKILDQWDELSEVKVTKKWPESVDVWLRFEEPKLVWNSGGKLYLLNEVGLVLRSIEEPERLEKFQDLPVMGDLSSLSVELDQRIVSRDFVDFVYSVRDNVANSVGLPIEAYEIEETTFELRVRFAPGFEVYFDTLRDPVAQVEKLNIFLKSGTRVDEYIDLRVAGKVYYR